MDVKHPNMTQKEHIRKYLKHYLFIIPAKLGGRVWAGKMFGSETSRACRAMRANKGELSSHFNGKFEVFYLKKNEALVRSGAYKKRHSVTINRDSNEQQASAKKESVDLFTEKGGI